jgi:hypothetical protein
MHRLPNARDMPPENFILKRLIFSGLYFRSERDWGIFVHLTPADRKNSPQNRNDIADLG